jgi:hypothetical protein
MSQNNERLRYPIAYLTTFILSILMTLLLTLCVIKQAFMTEQAIISAFDQSAYAELARDALIENTKEIIIQYGVDESIIDDLFNPLQFETDLKGSLHSIWTNQVHLVDTSSLLVKIKDRLNQYLLKNGFTITTEIQIGIDEASQLVIEEYQKKSTIPLIHTYSTLISNYNHYFIYGVLTLGGLLLGLSYFLYRLLSKSKVLLFMGYAVATSSWLILLLALYLKMDGVYTRIQIRPEYINKLIVSVGSNALDYFMYVALSGMVGSLILFCFAYYNSQRVLDS